MGQFLDNAAVNTKKPAVSIVKCKEYSYKLVRSSIERALKPLGGIENYVRPGDKVINLPKLKTHVQMAVTLGIKEYVWLCCW